VFHRLRVGIQVSWFSGIAADGIPSGRPAMEGRTPVAPSGWQQGLSSWRGVHAGTCYAWPLPADATCATVARQAFRDAVSEVGLEADPLEDCVLMASELAANTLHAQAVAEAGGGGNRLGSVMTDVEGEPSTSAGPAAQTRRDPRPPGVGQASRIPQSHRPSRVPGYPLAPRPARAPQAELWLYLRPRDRARAGLQGLRLLPRLAGRRPAASVRGVSVPDARRGRQRARAADRARAVRRPGPRRRR
jgi:hypothetical protein